MSAKTLEIPNLDDCLPTITQGDRGLEVAILQRFLVFYDYLSDTAVNSIFDSFTDNAVRQFQRDHGLDNDGVVNPTMWKTLADTLA